MTLDESGGGVMTLAEFNRLKSDRDREARKERERFANAIVKAISTSDCDRLYRIGTCDDPYDGWRLAFHRISKDAVPDISSDIKDTFQQVWIENKNMALRVGSHRMLCRALRRLLPPYAGSAVELYRGATVHGWNRGVSWSASIEAARLFFHKELASSALIKTVANPEAIICRIEYPPPFTDEEMSEFRAEYGVANVSVPDFDEEQEYIVDPSLLTGFEIVERGEEIA